MDWIVWAAGAIVVWFIFYNIFRCIAPKQSTRRKLMIATWSAPSEGNVYGTFEIDVSKTQEYIAKVRKEEGVHLTITHIGIKAIGVAMKEAPFMCGRLIWGKFFPYPSVDVGCLVNIDGGKDLANAKIPNADKTSYVDIVNTLQSKADKLRKGKDEDWKKTTKTLQLLPIFLLRPLVYWVGFLGGAIGLDIPLLGVKRFPFGCCLLTSVGMLGLDQAFVPFAPYARVPLLVMIGAIKDKPVVVDGEIVVRPILTVTATLDHRFVDGAQAALVAKKFREIMSNPAPFALAHDDAKKDQ